MPVQVKVKVALAIKFPVVSDPAVAFVPDQVPEAVHELASIDVQLSIDAEPDAIDVGLADRVTVGGGEDTVDPEPYPTWNTWTTGTQLPVEQGSTR